MGARPYDPLLARFLEADPIEGGNTNDYDYCSSDPIGCTDLDGQFGIKIGPTQNRRRLHARNQPQRKLPSW